jgi:hypothetical protein
VRARWVHRVETFGDPELPWSLFSVLSKEDSAEPRAEDARVLVHDDHVQGIEVRFMRTTQPPIGFTYGELE